MLSTTIGDRDLKVCLMNAAGCGCTSHEEIENLMKNPAVGMVVSKTATLTEKKGNPEPQIYIDEIFGLNSVGLENDGIDYYIEFATKYRYMWPKPFAFSIFASSPEELEEMIIKIKLKFEHPIIELNVSCPNVSKSATLEVLGPKTCEHPTVMFGVKLPPIFEREKIKEVSEIISSSNISYVVCCNSIPNGVAIDPVTQYRRISTTRGGVSGKPVKPIALSNVLDFYRELSSIDIIGCGGISTGMDVFEYILCGASAVQIGTEVLRNPECFERIKLELEEIMQTKSYAKIQCFRGII